MTAHATAAVPAAGMAGAGSAPDAGMVLQRECGCGHGTAAGDCQTCNDAWDTDGRDKRGDRPNRGPELGTNRGPSPAIGKIPSIVREVVESPGQPLGARTRTFFESRFRHDFSQVKVHADGKAAESARSVGAMAYTVGKHVAFGTANYDPGSVKGNALLAHELAHVVQQAKHAHADTSPTAISNPADAAEVEADSAAGQIMRGDDAVAVNQRVGATVSTLSSGATAALGITAGVAGAVGLGLGIAALAGAFDRSTFSDDELKTYLAAVQGGRIQGKTDSDNKARAVVARWKSGNPAFALDTPTKAVLIREMQDGRVTDDDREGILTLLENTTGKELVDLLSPALVDFAQLLDDLDSGAYRDRLILLFVRRAELHKDLILEQFADWYARKYFDKSQQPVVKKVLNDLLAVSGLDFTDANEFRNEIFKRSRVSQLMEESQAENNGFDYPENVGPNSGCADYQPPQGTNKINLANARVNKDARDYWSGVVLDSQLIYYFDLTSKGRNNAYEALTRLFTPQKSICDKTLIHCDYLVNVIQFRAYAESMGTDKFDGLVRSGRIVMRLTYSGFPQPWPAWPDPRSPKSLGYQQNVRPRTRDDFIIGDHVIFWNHLAFDGLNVQQQSPWRLENAVLVDKDSAGQDLFQGHGSGPKITEHDMLKELIGAEGGYNSLARPAIKITGDIDHGLPREADRQREYPGVIKQQDKWVVVDPGTQPGRGGRMYDLRLADADHPEAEPLLPGLKDPLNPGVFGEVDRPIESAPGKPPTP